MGTGGGSRVGSREGYEDVGAGRVRGSTPPSTHLNNQYFWIEKIKINKRRDGTRENTRGNGRPPLKTNTFGSKCIGFTNAGKVRYQGSPRGVSGRVPGGHQEK